MPNTYQLTVINQSENPDLDFAVFSTMPVESDNASVALAWLVQRIDAGNQYTFTWEIQWGLAWSASGAEAGYTWSASGSIDADPNVDALAGATLDYDGDFSLKSTAVKADGRHLRVENTADVPTHSTKPSSIAVTLGGNPALAVNAGPNLHQTFTLHPTYYIDAGQYVQGQMVDGDSVTDFQELVYEAPNTALTATLTAQNTWKVG